MCLLKYIPKLGWKGWNSTSWYIPSRDEGGCRAYKTWTYTWSYIYIVNTSIFLRWLEKLKEIPQVKIQQKANNTFCKFEVIYLNPKPASVWPFGVEDFVSGANIGMYPKNVYLEDHPSY